MGSYYNVCLCAACAIDFHSVVALRIFDEMLILNIIVAVPLTWFSHRLHVVSQSL